MAKEGSMEQSQDCKLGSSQVAVPVEHIKDTDLEQNSQQDTKHVDLPPENELGSVDILPESADIYSGSAAQLNNNNDDAAVALPNLDQLMINTSDPDVSAIESPVLPKTNINSLPFEVFQIIVEIVVVKEELWRSFELRRTGHRWNEAILRAICFTGVLDPLTRYGFAGYRSGTYHLTYQHRYPHLFTVGNHPHVVPLMCKIASSPRYEINSLTLTIRLAADWIDRNYGTLLPERDKNIKHMAEIVMFMSELQFWDSFIKEGETPQDAKDRFERNLQESTTIPRSTEYLRDAQAADLALGIASYTGQEEVFKQISQNLPNDMIVPELILTTVVAASHQGNLQALKGTLSGLVLSRSPYLHADHWANTFHRLMIFPRVFDPLRLVMEQAAVGSQPHILEWALEKGKQYRHHTFERDALKVAMGRARSLEIVKLLWAKCPKDSSGSATALYRTRLAFLAAAFGKVDIVEFMWQQGFDPEIQAIGRWFCEWEGYKGPNIRNEYIMNVAVMHGQKDVVELLLKGGVSPRKSVGPNGFPVGDAMICAIRKGRTDIIQLLRDYGYDDDEVDENDEERQKKRSKFFTSVKEAVQKGSAPDPSGKGKGKSVTKPTRRPTTQNASVRDGRRGSVRLHDKVRSVFRDLLNRSG